VGLYDDRAQRRPGAADLAAAASLRCARRVAVTLLDWIGLIGAVLLGIYLVVALLKPEYFE